jgi:hypothetical protein
MGRQIDLIDVSGEREICEGFKQKYLISDRYEILLNTLTTDVKLGNHSHHFAQFGYCFSGQFNFCVENNVYLIKENDSYNLIPDVVHGAEVLEEIYTIDFKYTIHEKLSNTIDLNVLKSTQNEGDEFTLPEIKVIRLKRESFSDLKSYNLEMYNENFLMVGGKTTISVDNNFFELSEMTIYRLSVDDTNICVDLKIEDGDNLFILQVK